MCKQLQSCLVGSSAGTSLLSNLAVVECVSGPSMQAQREAHARELMGILTSLWEAMGIPEEHIDRHHYVSMMGHNSSVRLHTKSLEKVWHMGLCKVVTSETRSLLAAKERCVMYVPCDRSGSWYTCPSCHLIRWWNRQYVYTASSGLAEELR